VTITTAESLARGAGAIEARCVVLTHRGAPPGDAELPAGYRAVLWRPTLRQPLPPVVLSPARVAWTALHVAHVFANREYGQLLIFHGDAVVHRSAIFPGFARFRFMAPADLQIGDTWTDPAHRGRGLAAAAIREVLCRCAAPERTFWYLTEITNTASIRAAERAGLRRSYESVRTRRLGLRLLGEFVLVGPVH
jgi:RimJ/RimL family protein N-acetyltransferase